MTRTLRMIVTATIALWSAAASAGNSAAPGDQPQPPSGAAPSTPAPVVAPPSTPPQTTAPAAVPVPPAAQQGTPATVLDARDYESLLGKGVRAVNGDDLGRVIDVIIDKDGRPRAAIIDFGGFLGVGSRKIAVDWRSLRFSADGKPGPVTLTLNRNQVRVSPEYKSGDPIVVLGPASPSGSPADGDVAAAPAAPATGPAPAPTPSPADKPADKAPDK